MEDIRPKYFADEEIVCAMSNECANLRAIAVAAMDVRSIVIESLRKGDLPTQTLDPLRLKIFSAAAEIAEKTEENLRTIVRCGGDTETVIENACCVLNSMSTRRGYGGITLTEIAAIALTAIACGMEA